MARNIMIQGTCSDAGKSIIAAGLCRIFKEDGYKVAPFKSQNMALNSFATLSGKEIGRAQAMQAEACGIECDERMNPVLLKPTDDRGSQVVVMGEVYDVMKAREYFSYRKKLMPVIKSAYESLANEFDIIVIEGAGSPAELNLKKDDIVNMGLAKELSAPVVLVADIDRGGVFAQLYGTVSLLEKEERNRIEGLIVNKFRGDVGLFADGIDILEDKCKKDVLGVVPFINDLKIDGEDSLALEGLIKYAENKKIFVGNKNISAKYNKTSDVNNEQYAEKNKQSAENNILIIKLPHISNYTDFAPLVYESDYNVMFSDEVSEIEKADIIIIPGTKNTIGDLRWLKAKGLDKALYGAKKSGKVILGICGGYQMLGQTIEDKDGMEGKAAVEKGIGLLPVKSEFTQKKCVRRIKADVLYEDVGQMSSEFMARTVCGKKKFTYEIHMGKTQLLKDGLIPFAKLFDGGFDGCVYENVYGTYLHGLFDTKEGKELQYNRLSAVMREALDMEKIYGIMEKYK